MRLALAVALLVTSSAAAAQEVGDRVVVTVEQAELRDGASVVAVVPRDYRLTIEEIDGERLRVRFEGVTGWVNPRDVVPFERAVEYYDEVIRANPFVTKYFRYRAFFHLNDGDIRLAILDQNVAIALEPQNAKLLAERGLAWLIGGAEEQAVADLEEALRLDPSLAVAYHNRGLLHYARDDFAEALADFDEAIRLDPQKALYFKNRGELRLQTGDIAGCLEDVNETIRLDPYGYGAEARVKRAWVLKRDGRFDEAIAECVEAVRVRPTYAVAHHHLAWILATCPDDPLRDGQKALEHAVTARNLSRDDDSTDDDFMVFEALAAAFAECGDFDSAVEHQSRAVELAPSERKAECRECLVSYRSGQPTRHAPTWLPPARKPPVEAAKPQRSTAAP